MKEKLVTPRGVALIQGENVVRVMRTHPKYLFMPMVITVLAVVLAIFTALNVPSSWNDLPAKGIVWGAIAILWILGSIKRIYIWLSHKYVITTRQVVKLTGFIWIQGHATKIERISDISAEQGLLDRIFGCGTLNLINASAGTQTTAPQVRLHDVPNVHKVYQQIEELSEASRRTMPTYQQFSVGLAGESAHELPVPEKQDAGASEARPARWGINGG
ncbi:PH domain-containing protein [Glutamicibacter arilaitensis]|uniref:PH domain-containing protein n=1 Tax=Glutamicibacter arilaitensis TaxID=256701 RepID=UPI003FD65D04